jgi:predicted nucleotidyltransferase
MNSQPKMEEMIRLIRNCIDSVDAGAEAILYGSHARGEADSDSDWDIIVLTDYPLDPGMEEKFREKLYDLEIETGEPLSIFLFSKQEWHTKQRITPFYRNVEKEGIPL